MRRVAWCGGGSGSGVAGGKARTACVLVVALGTAVAAPAAAHAQANAEDELAVLGVNALLGGATSGMAALIQGRSFFRAVGVGLAGGVVAYGGKRFASWHGIPGSGLAGRFFTAVGASMVRNGAAGRGPFDLVLLPAGPVTFYLRPENDSTNAPVKLNLARAALFAALAVHDDFRLDPEASLHAGAPVFAARSGVLGRKAGKVTLGLAICGSVIVNDLDGLRLRRRVPRGALLAHERVHVLQDDFSEIVWAGPIEGWLLSHLPGGAWLRRYVEPGILQAAAVGAVLLAAPEDSPWEREADYMESAWEVGL